MPALHSCISLIAMNPQPLDLHILMETDVNKIYWITICFSFFQVLG